MFTVVVCLAVRVIDLGSKSVFADELASFRFAQLSWTDFWRLVRSSEANMALYYVLLRFWTHIHSSISFIRFLSVIPAVATVPALYLLGKKLFSAPAALLASLLFSLNTFHISYSQAGRGYTLAVFLVALSCLYFVRSVQHPTRANAVVYVIASTAAMYGHFFAAFVLASQLLALFLLRPVRPVLTRQTVLIALVAVLAMPLLIFAAVHRTQPIAWVQPTTGKEVYHFFAYLSGSGLKFGLSVIALAVAGREWWRRVQLHEETTQPFILVTLWLLLPLGITLLLSLWRPVFSPRFLMICLPAFVLLVTEGLTLIRPPWARYLMTATLLVSCVTALPAYYRQPGIEDWKSAVTYLNQHVGSADTIVVNNPAYRSILEYSFPEFGLRLPTQRIVLGPAKQISAADSDHIWLLLCHAAPAEAEDITALKVHFGVRTVAHFNGIEVMEFVGDASH
jgi:uncharacterized membrane protein